MTDWRTLFDEDYYERGVERGISLYTNYRWIPELTIPMAANLCETLGIPVGAKVMDFGCAKGYLVHALRLLRRNAWGYDVSVYAMSQSPKEVTDYLFGLMNFVDGEDRLPNEDHRYPYDWVIAKDVLEHIPEDELQRWLKAIRRSTPKLFVAVPLGDGARYIVPAYERDTTHKIRQPLRWWGDQLMKAGFTLDSMEYRMDGIKENYTQWEEGNGFLIAHTP